VSGRVKHLSIFLPQETPFYRGLLAQMRRGFEAEGVTTSGLCRHLGADEMAAWCAAHAPDAIFEMNRPRRDAPFVPREIAHIVWVVDFNGRSLDHFEGSEITYLFGLTWPGRYPHSGFHRWFGPGACQVDYAENAAPDLGAGDIDASFAGHIPRPWSPAERARDLGGGFTFGELLPELEARLRGARGRLYTADDFLAIAEDLARARGVGPLVLDATLRYDVSGRTVRMLNRADLIDRVLQVTEAVALYGSESWGAWPRYARFYRGFLAEPAALRAVYQRARITLHEGNGVHFRAMDCMAAGGLLFFRSTAHDQLPGGIRTLFEPHVHYVPFEIEELPAAAAAYLGDPARATKVRREAAAAIRAGHTWRHRAREVLRDLAAI
jgi:hypothetical protein